MVVLWTAGPLFKRFFFFAQVAVWSNSFPEYIWWNYLSLFPRGTGFLNWIFLIVFTRISGACIRRIICRIPVHSRWEKEPDAASTSDLKIHHHVHVPWLDEEQLGTGEAREGHTIAFWIKKSITYRRMWVGLVLFFFFCRLFEHHSQHWLPCISLLFLNIRVALNKPLCSVPLGGVWYKLKKIKLLWQHNSMSVHGYHSLQCGHSVILAISSCSDLKHECCCNKQVI